MNVLGILCSNPAQLDKAKINMIEAKVFILPSRVLAPHPSFMITCPSWNLTLHNAATIHG